MGIMIGAIVASQTAMRVAAMNAMKKIWKIRKKLLTNSPKCAILIMSKGTTERKVNKNDEDRNDQTRYGRPH